MWVPEAVHFQIQNARPDNDAVFSITKHRAPKPWTVIHHADEPAAMQPAPQSAARPTAARPAPAPESEETRRKKELAMEVENLVAQHGCGSVIDAAWKASDKLHPWSHRTQ